MKLICFFLLSASFSACKYNNGLAPVAANHYPVKSNSAAVALTDKTYENGTYCATLKYYNLKAEINTKCNLLIDVKNNELTKINSSDCDWVEESNFLPRKFDEVGSVSFADNNGNEYTVTINETKPLRSKKFECDICGKEFK